MSALELVVPWPLALVGPILAQLALWARLPWVLVLWVPQSPRAAQVLPLEQVRVVERVVGALLMVPSWFREQELQGRSLGQQ